MIDASRARELAKMPARFKSNIADAICQRILVSAYQKKFGLAFFTGSDCLSEEDKKQLSDLGYKLKYNKATLCYEIDF